MEESYNEPIPENYENLNASDFSAVNPKIKVDQIEFEGLKRSDRKFLMEAIRRTTMEKSSNLIELSAALSDSFRRLERLNIFKNVSVTIDPSEQGNRENDTDVHGVKVVFNCKEKRFNIKTGTEFQRKDIVWNFGGNFFNLFGNAEGLEINSSVGANSSMPFNLNFTKPLSGDPDKIFFINAANFKENFLNHCKWKQESGIFVVGINLQMNEKSRHELKYLADFRRLFDVQSGASHVIRDQAGKSFKSAIIHSWSTSNRDSSVFPTRGHILRLSNELAGIGGDAKFFKSELLLQNNWSKGIFTLTKTFKMGKVIPFSSSNPVSVIDKFKMGGPTSIRGFPVNSLGPRQFDDALGGNCLIETGLQLSFPLMKSAANFARAHLFMNAGLLSDQFICKPICEAFKAKPVHSITALNTNMSVGGGLMFKMAESVRLELNFSVPIFSQKNVSPSNGLQIGIGMEFL